MARKNVALPFTPEARALIDNCPEIINIFAQRLSEQLDHSAICGRPVFNRAKLIRTMSVEDLAEYLKRNLRNGLPEDVYAWLMEEVRSDATDKTH